VPITPMFIFLLSSSVDFSQFFSSAHLSRA
jgi:hypothetical protein